MQPPDLYMHMLFDIILYKKTVDFRYVIVKYNSLHNINMKIFANYTFLAIIILLPGVKELSGESSLSSFK